jgi:RNA polymerase sigma-70 factor (ECF subfamily)
VYRFVARLTGSESVPEKIVNEVFLEVWRDAGQFTGTSQVATWLLGIARFKALSQRRRSQMTWNRHARHFLEDASDRAAALSNKHRRRDVPESCTTMLMPIRGW